MKLRSQISLLLFMFGLVPLLFAQGPGSELQRPLAITIIGGLALTTLLTLIYTPLLYMVAHRIRPGMEVEAADGHAGTAGELVVDPQSAEITHFVLREGHLWGKKEVTLPVAAVERVARDRVYLKLDKQAIGQLPAIPVRRRQANADGVEIQRLALAIIEIE